LFKNIKCLTRHWWCTPAIPAVRRLRQKDLEFKVSLYYRVRPCLKKKKKKRDRNKNRLRMKDEKKIYQANGPRKQAGVTILISDKVDFKPTLIK
jgi:hypothetical protein